jgi:uncharacterized LabA/DUF88 family protein
MEVAVFIDWQNAYRSARRAFGLQNLPNEHGNFSPYQLARILAAANGRGANGTLVRVQVHRGLPHSSRDSLGYAANRRQATAWVKEAPQIVVPCQRPLRYPHDPADRPVEKGIDVELALGAVEQLATERCGVAIIFSHDSDLNPAVETIIRLKGPSAVETAAWSSPSHRSRLRQRPGVHHHEISREVFQRIATPVNYAHNR